jgi:hypothetical protein
MTIRIDLKSIKASTTGEMLRIVNKRLGNVLQFHPFITSAPRTHMTEQKWFRRRVYTEIDGNVVSYRIENIPMTSEQRRSVISYK